MRLTIAGLAALCFAFVLTGCQPTIKSPWTGNDVTQSQLEAEAAERKAALQGEAAQAEADLASALASLQGEQVSKLAAIEAKFKPMLAGIGARVEALAGTLKASSEALAEKAALNASLWNFGMNAGGEVIKSIPGGPLTLIGGLGLGLLGTIIQSRRLGQAKGTLGSLAQAISAANTSTPTGEHDAKWDATFGAVATPAARALVATSGIK